MILGGKAFSPNSANNDSGAETPKKRAVILDENGVWRPGEQDDSENAEDKHQLQCSIADRIAGERVSYRLIQQRSLDFGLYNQLNKCTLDKAIALNESPESEDSGNQCSTSSVSQQHPPFRPREDEVAGRLIVSHSPSEDAVLHMIQSKEVTKQFSLRDVLGHRVPELAEDDDGQSEQNLFQEEIVPMPPMPQTDTLS